MEQVGWKAGFGTAAAMEALGTARPLAAPLSDATLEPSGATVEVADWTNPLLEPELAVRVGEDGGIAAIAPAIELVDIDGPTDDVDAILATGIFHRAWLVGEWAERSPDGLTLDVGEHEGADPWALTGRAEDVLRTMHDAVADRGAALRPGDVVICGSAVPAIKVAPGDDVTVRFNGLGEIAVRLG